jgi:hypothetical protein
MQSAKLYLKDVEKNPFRIANDINSAIMTLQKNQEFGFQEGNTAWMAGLPEFVMSPDIHHQCFYVHFTLDGRKRKLQVFVQYPDETPEETYDTLLSLGAQEGSREILMACAEKITPKQGYYYQNDREFPEPVKIFVES